jgi:hypothetical protein
MINVHQLGVEAREKADRLLQEGKRVPVIEFADEVTSGKVPISEMIGTDDGAREFVEKITFDIVQGQELEPLLYKDLYNTQTDPNFPKTMLADEFGNVRVVFLEHLEGGEVKFGQVGPGIQKVINFVTYATGVEYDEDIVEYNQTWKVSQIGVAVGKAYNKLLNHLHLYPIISATYDTSHAGDLNAQWQAQLGDPQLDGYGGVAQDIPFDTDLATTLGNALSVLPNGAKLLINSTDYMRIMTAVDAAVTYGGNPLPIKQKLSDASFIIYNGTFITVGGKKYTYSGVPAGTAFLVSDAKQNFFEYIKHDVRTDSADGDLSRLILAQLVARARRANLVIPGGEYGAVKIDLHA